jgi:hypothetical protein
MKVFPHGSCRAHSAKNIDGLRYDRAVMIHTIARTQPRVVKTFARSVVASFGNVQCEYENLGSARNRHGARIYLCFDDHDTVVRSSYVAFDYQSIMMGAAACDWALDNSIGRVLRVNHIDVVNHLNSMSEEHVSECVELPRVDEMLVECALDYLAKR